MDHLERIVRSEKVSQAANIGAEVARHAAILAYDAVLAPLISIVPRFGESFFDFVEEKAPWLEHERVVGGPSAHKHDLAVGTLPAIAGGMSIFAALLSAGYYPEANVAKWVGIGFDAWSAAYFLFKHYSNVCDIPQQR